MSSPLRGMVCPDCRGVRLLEARKTFYVAGKTIRYRRCSACGCLVKTEEKIVPHSPRAAVPENTSLALDQYS